MRKMLLLATLFFIPLIGFAEVPPNLVFSEIAWMGTNASANDEWIELFNPTDSLIDLSGWVVRDSEEKLMIELAGNLAPQAYFFMERSDDSTVIDVLADLVYTGALKNSDLTLQLIDPSGMVVDEVVAWPAGDNSLKASMERADFTSENWCTNNGVHVNGLDADGGAILGTPGQPNSCGMVIEPEEEILENVELPEDEEIPEDMPEPVPVPPAIVINEVLPDPETDEADNEFIELLNVGELTLNLSGFVLDDNDLEDGAFYTFPKNTILNPGEFLVVYRSKTDITLNNDMDSIHLFDDAGNLIDTFSYKSTKSGRSWGRDSENPEEWILFSNLTPGEGNVFVNHPPVPVITLQKDSKYMGVNVTAEETTDPEGGDLIYEWVFEEGAMDFKQNPAKYTYSTEGQKTITLTVTDEFGLSTQVSVAFQAVEKEAGGKSFASRLRELEQLNGLVENKPEFVLGTVIIERALPNPEGSDKGNERLILKNTTNSPVELSGWVLEDAKGARHTFDSFLLSGSQVFEQSVFKLNLNNKDEALKLFDPAGNVVDELSWKKSKEGKWIFHSSFFHNGMTATVNRVVDGDTFEIELGGQLFLVRMIGIDTPETVHPDKPVQYFGQQASDFLRQQLEGQTVRFEFENFKIDTYGRLLAYVYLGDIFMNAEIIEQGYGYAYTRFDFLYRDHFVTLQEKAQFDQVGMWQQLKIQDSVPDEVLEFEAMAELDEEESVLDPALEVIVEASVEVVEEGVEPVLDCLSPDLKIEAILPNNQKGKTTEFIRLKNTGSDSVCLSGWSLDDALEKGSKPFEIPGGAIAGGGVRTFRRSETGIALNNRNDCAFLIDPSGRPVDHICYDRTHKNEVFTHAGGDWRPPVKKSSKATSSSRRSLGRDVSAYQFELVNGKVSGTIELVDAKNEMLYVHLPDSSVLPVSYASSGVDFEAAAMMMDFKKPLELQVRSGEESPVLVALKPLERLYSPLPTAPEKPISNSASVWLWLLASLPVAVGVKWWLL